MKFREFLYERPDYEAVKSQMETLMAELACAEDSDAFLKIFGEINVLRGHYDTMSTLCHVRNSIDTKDPFYDAETSYWDEYGPLYQNLESKLFRLVLHSPFAPELREKIPETYFKRAEFNEKSFREDIIPDLQEENRLVTEYSKLIAGAAVEFEGKTYNLAQLKALSLSTDRALRQRAYDARMSFFVEHEAAIDTLFDRLVKLRDTIAKKLGFQNFVELGYVRMLRYDYDRDDVAAYREEVKKHLVPVANKLYDAQKKRLGQERLRYFDEPIEFLSGNPTPKGTPEELVAAAKNMYHEMSEETGEFIDVMVEQELMDLVSRAGKRGGGYCTSLWDYKVPFIFANFNGTSGDADVLTHEAGHAFQRYQSRNIPIPECLGATKETAEIFSMSMEFFAWRWSKKFFKEDTEKYHFLHLGGAVKFVPYGVLVDHFQHEVYEHPELTPDERKSVWRSLERQYLPHKDYEGCDILERGCWWFQQGHIFSTPFYYIDYTLAQVCALQFWKRIEIDHDPKAWSDYLAICRRGGTLPFRKMLKIANLKVPFEQGVLGEVASAIEAYLAAFDTSKM